MQTGIGYNHSPSDKEFGVKLGNIYSFSRYGVTDNIDIGLKISGIPQLLGGFNADIRYGILKNPFSLSVSTSWYHGAVKELDGVGRWHGYGGTVSMGVNQLYFGANLQVTSYNYHETWQIGEDSGFSDEWAYSIFFGKEIGSKRRIVPEIGLLYTQETFIPFIGLGLKTNI